MKTIIYLTTLLLIITSCNKKRQENLRLNNLSIQAALEEDRAQSIKDIELSNVEGYFAVAKVKKPTGVILNKSNFESYFHPAKTMDNIVTMIDFDTQKAGAILLPETKNDVIISIDSSYLVSKTLKIVYSMMQSHADRTFTITPFKIFTFDTSSHIDSVAFYNGDDSIHIGIQ